MEKDTYSLEDIITEALEILQRSFCEANDIVVEMEWLEDQSFRKFARKMIETALNDLLNKPLKDYKVNNRYIIPAEDRKKILFDVFMGTFANVLQAGYLPGVELGPLAKQMHNRDKDYSWKIVKSGPEKLDQEWKDAQAPLMHALSTCLLDYKIYGVDDEQAYYNYLAKSGLEADEIPRFMQLFGEISAAQAAHSLLEYFPAIYRSWYYFAILVYLAELSEPPEYFKKSWSMAQNVDLKEIQTSFAQIGEACEKLIGHLEPVKEQIWLEEYILFKKKYNHSANEPTD